MDRSERDLRKLPAAVAHELRNPIAAVQAGIEELRDGLVDPSAGGLAGLHDQSLRLGRVVSDLAELSAAESISVPVHRPEVDLPQVADDELAVHASHPRAAALTVGSRPPGPVLARPTFTENAPASTGGAAQFYHVTQ